MASEVRQHYLPTSAGWANNATIADKRRPRARSKRPQRRPPRFFGPPRDALDTAAGALSALSSASSASAVSSGLSATCADFSSVADSRDGQYSRHSSSATSPSGATSSSSATLSPRRVAAIAL